MDHVTGLGAKCFTPAWKAKDFKYFLAHPQGLSLGIFQDQKLIAYLLTLFVQGEMDFVSVATDPEFRKKGLAKILVRHALSTPGVEKAMLEVDTENVPAIQLYQGVGFEIQGTRRKYYEGKRDAYFMTLILLGSF